MFFALSLINPQSIIGLDQNKLQKFVEDWSDEKQERLDNFMVLWIGASTLPVSAVQDTNMAILRYDRSLRL